MKTLTPEKFYNQIQHKYQIDFDGKASAMFHPIHTPSFVVDFARKYASLVAEENNKTNKPVRGFLAEILDMEVPSHDEIIIKREAGSRIQEFSFNYLAEKIQQYYARIAEEEKRKALKIISELIAIQSAEINEDNVEVIEKIINDAKEFYNEHEK